MPATSPHFVFDFVDPLSYLTELALVELEANTGVRVERIGRELRPPPAPLTRVSDPIWAERWSTARVAPGNAELRPPQLVPWTRKAHELHALAGQRGIAPEIRKGIFEAYFLEGRDIGRIDELVSIAAAGGLDRTEVKAALDVDRHEEDVVAARRRAEELGAHVVPSLVVDGKVVEGFHNPADLSTLLGGSPRGGR